MRVHRRNITTLVGYCYEGTYMGLIYEYMANGDLAEHLSGLGMIEILSKDYFRFLLIKSYPPQRLNFL
jgi:predicted Kef-type K+ transport protein